MIAISMLACLAGAVTENEHALATRVEQVTVYPERALVTRRAQLPAGGGRFVVSGLPAAMDPSSLRASCADALVLGIDTRVRTLPAAPEERLRAVRERVREAQRAIAALEDDAAVQQRIAAHLARLLELQAREHAEAVRSGRAGGEGWQNELDFLAKQLDDNRKARREIEWRLEDARAQLKDAELEQGRVCGPGATSREVVVEVAADSPAAQLEVAYLVANAGWRPRYDLRASRDARSVELGYRAQVWQRTEEDWNDVALALSTARPDLGAQGPELQPVWLTLDEERARLEAKVTRMAAPGEEAAARDSAVDSVTAAVVSQGLSVQFQLPARETVQSRPEPSDVRIGSAVLEVAPEYFAAPALDANVWLRGRARNTSEWTLLPGAAAVYVGDDFLGTSKLAAVQPGEELLLHLGPDPALTIERTVLADLTASRGVFGGGSSRTQRFRVRISNDGAAAARADGSVLVYVREALPRSTDSRVVVKLLDPKPAPAGDERWKKEREEQGILTWAVAVPRGGEALLGYGVALEFPKGLQIYE